ncbi:hypothetical protein [Streptantibioticus ferralitis]|uniref:Uncharacterized protein n=1 Tax=Streptantibioticus ferralitis TaxID=236510 RepID=A0ABT5Z9L8_9ACTN|nr:hypothetical protein [Streptantibioticus ferralitis]MDF2260531.1 hypothetical protein [Streptantibioticus ferralitis]
MLARTLPIPESTRPLVPLYMVVWERDFERRQQHERRRAAAAASMGHDYPYTYPGAQMAV